jgi:hypothetical protein
MALEYLAKPSRFPNLERFMMNIRHLSGKALIDVLYARPGSARPDVSDAPIVEGTFTPVKRPSGGSEDGAR